MVATSPTTDKAYRGVDHVIGLTYTPPDGEDLADITITAMLTAPGKVAVPADTVTFDPATGAITATWQEATTRNLATNLIYEARFVRDVAGSTRVFYIRRVQVL